jgi:hypothetical protein
MVAVMVTVPLAAPAVTRPAELTVTVLGVEGRPRPK